MYSSWEYVINADEHYTYTYTFYTLTIDLTHAFKHLSTSARFCQWREWMQVCVFIYMCLQRVVSQWTWIFYHLPHVCILSVRRTRMNVCLLSWLFVCTYTEWRGSKDLLGFISFVSTQVMKRLRSPFHPDMVMFSQLHHELFSKPDLCWYYCPLGTTVHVVQSASPTVAM